MPLTEWLTKTEIYFLTIWKTEVQNPEIERAMVPGVLPCTSQLLVAVISSVLLNHLSLPLASVTVSLCFSPHMAFSFCYKDTSHIGLKLILITSSYLDYKDTICKDTISKQGHAHRFRRLGLQYIFWQDTTQAITSGK